VTIGESTLFKQQEQEIVACSSSEAAPTPVLRNSNKMVSLGDISMLSMEEDEEKTLAGLVSSLFPKSVKGQCYCLLTTLMLVIGCAIVAGYCGAGLCGKEKSSSSLKDSSNANSNVGPPTPAPVPPFFRSSAPTISPALTLAPTPTRKAFTSTEELYKAVDEYLETGQAVNLEYGHPIGNWDVRLIEDFTSVFDAKRNPLAATFNEDLLHWKTERATSMKWMFRHAEKFNGTVSSFDTSSVTDFEGMFQDCSSFVGTSVAGFQTGSVTTFRETFARCPSFRGDLSSWDVSSATTLEGMLRLVTYFNSDLSGWNTEKVTDMSYLVSNIFLSV